MVAAGDCPSKRRNVDAEWTPPRAVPTRDERVAGCLGRGRRIPRLRRTRPRMHIREAFRHLGGREFGVVGRRALSTHRLLDGDGGAG